ncbi:RNA pseudouridine synthase 1 [Acorus calamus]|uniref:RNA pseudouridine synthase 1 n=1 Tax=Acorus calamus TaxID=4465 RepID=A0AAV9D0C4_ACOCL|nr:RNA pseudouridine synthase 1 [Acorus calamus]
MTATDAREEALSAYPIPVSPLPPPGSRQAELNRAMSAASRSALFALSDSDVVFRDDWLLVVNKPPGVYCESVLSSSSARIGSGSLLHLANRLDRDTSGLMVMVSVSTDRAAAELARAFAEREVEKVYVASCVGSKPRWGRINVASGHGRSRHGIWRVYAASDVGRSLPGGSTVKRMETSIEVVSIGGRGGEKGEEIVVVEGPPGVRSEACESSCEGDDDREVVLVRARPRSGRTHQIRLHCQYLGIPIRGDVKYGGAGEWDGAVCGGHLLHAESLAFEHPVTGARLELRAPPPSWWPAEATPVLEIS